MNSCLLYWVMERTTVEPMQGRSTRFLFQPWTILRGYQKISCRVQFACVILKRVISEKCCLVYMGFTKDALISGWNEMRHVLFVNSM